MAILPAAIGIVYQPHEKAVLLVKRRDVPVWVLPGGGIDPDETPEEAVIREVFEETGFHIAIVRKCAEYLPSNSFTRLTHVFVCHVTGGEASLSAESSEVAFFPLEHLPTSFFKIHYDWLQDSLNHTDLVRKHLTQITLWEILKYTLRHPWHTIRYAYGRWVKRN